MKKKRQLYLQCSKQTTQVFTSHIHHLEMTFFLSLHHKDVLSLSTHLYFDCTATDGSDRFTDEIHIYFCGVLLQLSQDLKYIKGTIKADCMTDLHGDHVSS